MYICVLKEHWKCLLPIDFFSFQEGPLLSEVFSLTSPISFSFLQLFVLFFVEAEVPIVQHLSFMSCGPGVRIYLAYS